MSKSTNQFVSGAAGTQVDNGDKAKAYADQFIWHHMMKASGGKTYSEVSTLAQASPQDAKLAGLKATLFQGDMLRSSLLTAYAFSRFGLIAQWVTLICALGAIFAAGVFLALRRR
jgi:adenylylsulfate kinase-like enzyme